MAFRLVVFTFPNWEKCHLIFLPPLSSSFSQKTSDGSRQKVKDEEVLESVRKRIRQEKPLQTYQISLRYLLNTYHHHRSRHLGSVEEKIVSFYNGYFLEERKKVWPQSFFWQIAKQVKITQTYLTFVRFALMLWDSKSFSVICIYFFTCLKPNFVVKISVQEINNS